MSFGVSIGPKQKEDQPKQFDRVHILVFSRKFQIVSVCFKTVCFGRFISVPKQRVAIEPKQTEDTTRSV
jgi:hypothetical protein